MEKLQNVLNSVDAEVSVLEKELKHIQANVARSQKEVASVVSKTDKAAEKHDKLRNQFSGKRLTDKQTERLAAAKAALDVLTEQKREVKAENRAIRKKESDLKAELRPLKKARREVGKILSAEKKRLEEKEAKAKGLPPKKRGRKKKINMVWVDVLPDD